MIFKLDDKQIERACALERKNQMAFYEAKDGFEFNDIVVNDLSFISYDDNVKFKKMVWLGNLIGFVKSTGINDGFPVVNVAFNKTKKTLTLEGEREAITNKAIVDIVAEVLGNKWRIATPKCSGETHNVKLFWWETMEHYYRWRSDWATYLSWLVPNLDPEKGIEKFEDRFYNENQCLGMLRVGKISEARKYYPGIVDEILKIA